MSKSKLILLYSVLALITVTATIIFTFPFKTLEQRLSQHLSRALNLEVSLTSLAPSAFLGLKAQSLVIKTPKFPPLTLSNPNLKLNPSSLFLGIPEFNIYTQLWDGKIFINAIFDSIKNWKIGELKVELKDIRLSDSIAYLKDIYINSIDGSLDSTINLQYPKNFSLPRLGGQGNIKIINCNINFDTPLFKNILLQDIKTTIKFTIKNGVLKIKEGPVSLAGINGKIKGSIFLNKNINSSRINLAVELKIGSNLKNFPQSLKPLMSKRKKIRLNIQGTIANPKVSWL
ncbi:type II secretion system protein GspN [Desulfohalobiaceae bacterium Ax17]|uniref:type II secretion system protein GspN n=1 Tax=Desulfovulcanus ferrireducens TaxID=2831190 RepID=UPI00207BA4B4|nr:type II secretion system protein GspN [Desulfovulcanus ferrireducens]MBT8762570.1 type II secretion system protein GspN [Desulfovulcanus ferrireducens]